MLLPILVLALVASPLLAQEVDMQPLELIVVDFADPEGPAWRAVDDAVMGGVSQSRLRLTEAGSAVFEGDLSLENNGGFASVRAAIGRIDLSGFHGLAIRFRGDGRRYRLRLRTDAGFDGVAYQAAFDTPADEWATARIPFADFLPTFRGRILEGAEPLDPASIRQLGLMVADKQEGRFQLEIAAIVAYAEPPKRAR